MASSETTRARRSMSELRRGTVAFCVVALLEARERYAVELVGDLAASEALAAGQGTIYPLLSRLRADGRRPGRSPRRARPGATTG